jgi:thioredoxin 1
MIITVTDRDFAEKVIHTKKPTIVDLWAPWCQPCKALEKELQKLDITFGNKLTIAKVNIDQNPKTVAWLDIKTVPTLLFYNGKSSAPTSIHGSSTAELITAKFRLREATA